MRVVNIKKFIRSVLIILGLILMFSLIVSSSSFSHKQVEYTKFYVSEGETLWNIASDLQSNNLYYKDKDIRFIIEDLMDINNLENSSLYINQELNIPTV